MDLKASILLIAVVVSLLAVFMGRYEIVGVPAGGEGTVAYAYRLDRWTGEVTFIVGDQGLTVKVK